MERYKKLGWVKEQNFRDHFDELYDRFKKKAEELGLEGELKFVEEHGKVLIYVGL